MLGPVDRQDRRCPPGPATGCRSVPNGVRRAASACSVGPVGGRRPAVAAAGRRSSSGTLMRAPPSVAVQEGEGVDADGAGVVDARGSLRLAGEDHVRGAGVAEGGDQGGAPLGVRRVGAGQADDRLAVVRREHGVDAVGRAGDVDGDAAGGEQVGGEGGAGGVRGDRAHGGQEDRAWRRARRAAPRTPRRSGGPRSRRRGAGVRSGSFSPRFGNSLTPVSGRRAVGDLVVAGRDHLRRSGPQRARRSRAARTPPASSIRPSSAQPALARSSVSFSTA